MFVKIDFDSNELPAYEFVIQLQIETYFPKYIQSSWRQVSLSLSLDRSRVLKTRTTGKKNKRNEEKI